MVSHLKKLSYFMGGKILLFKHTKNLYVDLGDLQNEKENLTQFLQSNLNVSVSSAEGKLMVDSEKISLTELEHVVNKFIYHRDLNITHWVSTENSTVKINRFEGHSKEKKPEKEPPHQTAMQSWGL